MPFWLPTNNRSPATVGCDHAEVESKPERPLEGQLRNLCRGQPGALRGLRSGIRTVGDQPVQASVSGATRRGAGAEQRPAVDPVTSPPSERPVRNSETARRSAPVRRPPCGRIPPAVSAERIASGDRCRNTSGAGARVSAAPVWHMLHSRSKTAAPSGADATGTGTCALSGSYQTTVAATSTAAIHARITIRRSDATLQVPGPDATSSARCGTGRR